MVNTQPLNSYCLIIYFKKFRINYWPLEFYEFAKRTAQQLNISLGGVGVRYVRGKEEQELLKAGEIYSLTKSNANKLNILMNSSIGIDGLYFYNAPTNNPPKFMILLDSGFEANGLHRLYIECDERLLSPGVDFYKEALEILVHSEMIVDSIYGFARTFNALSKPEVYFSDFDTINVSVEDLNDLEIWRNHSLECETKIRNLYPLNLISKGHLEQFDGIDKMTSHLEDLFGGDSIKEIAEHKLCFRISNAQLSKSVRELFTDMLMK